MQEALLVNHVQFIRVINICSWHVNRMFANVQVDTFSLKQIAVCNPFLNFNYIAFTYFLVFFYSEIFHIWRELPKQRSVWCECRSHLSKRSLRVKLILFCLYISPKVYWLFFCNKDVQALNIGVLLRVVISSHLLIYDRLNNKWKLCTVNKQIVNTSCIRDIQCQTYNGLTCVNNLCS